MKRIEFTDEERRMAIQLFNIAVMERGLSVSAPATMLARKFADDPEPDTSEEPQELPQPD
tara:strand:- start:6617 stop:6796 length:180 start_codon:yes stop_codon:yes gene_type:complete